MAEGETKRPEGTTKRPEGTTKHPEEAAKSSEGAAKHPKGITKHPEGRSWEPDAGNMKILGRTLVHTGENTGRRARYLCYSGSYVEFTFTGRSLSCELISDYCEDQTDGTQYPCYMALYLDHQLVRRFSLMPGRHIYPLLSEGENSKRDAWKCEDPKRDDPEGNDSEEDVRTMDDLGGNDSEEDLRTMVVCLVKESEVQYASSGILAFYTDEEAEIRPTDKKDRKIEFIGDSITCGYGVLGGPKAPFSTETESADDAFAVQCARALDADYQLVSFSGIGVISRYIEPEKNEPLTDVLMPALYPHTDAVLAKRYGWRPESWDFSSFCPQVVVINLGTNDDSYTRGIREREERFEEEYCEFVRNIHRRNPEAEIVCTFGVMSQRLLPRVEEAVQRLSESGVPVRMHREEPMPPGEVTGCDGHPSAQRQRKMAESLTGFLLQEIFREDFAEDGMTECRQE